MKAGKPAFGFCMNIIDRAKLIQEAENDPKAQAAHLLLSSNDPVYWINTFCWTFDPLPRSPQPHLPFVLYPYQEWLVRRWIKKIENGEDFAIEKSRDMGITWLILMIFQWGWRFREGWNFLLGHRKEEMVDKAGDISTHFPKLRYNLQAMPSWMKPNGFRDDQHNCYMRLINPENGNSIVGESSNAYFGVGGRYKAVLFDELATWPFDEQAWSACGDSTACRIGLSTPYGKANKFARMALDPTNTKVLPPDSLIPPGNRPA